MATATEIAETLAGLRGPVSLSYRYEFRNLSDNSVISDVTDAVTDADISYNTKQEIVRSAQFTFDVSRLGTEYQGGRARAILPGKWVGITAVLTVIGNEISYPLGLYRLSSGVRMSLNENDNSIATADGLDPLILLLSTTQSPYTIPLGTAYSDAVVTILVAAGISRYYIQASAPTPVDFTWPTATSWLDICTDLLNGINYWPLWTDGDGIVYSTYRGDPEGAQFTIDATYGSVEPVMIVPDIEITDDWEREPNQVMVSIETPTRTLAGRTARNETVSPNGSLILGRVLTEKIPLDTALNDTTMLDEYGKWKVIEARANTVQATLQTFPDPRRNPRARQREIYSVIVDDYLNAYGSEPNRHYWQCVGWTLNLAQPGQLMIHQLASILPGAITLTNVTPEGI